MADPCAYARCTSPLGDTPFTLTLPGQPPLRFCSLTCCWSWLREHVEAQAQAVRTPELPPVPMPALMKPRVPSPVRRLKPPRRVAAVREGEPAPEAPGFHWIAGDASRWTRALLNTPGFMPVPDIFADRCPTCGVKRWVCMCPKGEGSCTSS